MTYSSGMNLKITTAHDFRAARERLGLTVSGLAFILNTDERNIRYWESGTRKLGPDKTACRCMEWMLAGFRPKEFALGGDLRRSDQPSASARAA